MIALAFAFGCGDDSGPQDEYVRPGGDGGMGAQYECEDEDGDGFGMYCSGGRDCNDADPDITDLCYRCIDENAGCPCEKGTKPLFCDPEDQHIVQDGIQGTLTCSEGTRYCRDELWSECEILLEYATFIPD